MQVQALNEELERMHEAQSGLRSQAWLKGKYVLLEVGPRHDCVDKTRYGKMGGKLLTTSDQHATMQAGRRRSILVARPA